MPMKNNKVFRLGRCIVAFVIGYVLTLVISFCSLIAWKPRGVPDGAVLKGDYDSYWIYEVEHNDSIIHLQIYNIDGDLALDADFESMGINNINPIGSFFNRTIFLKDSRTCHMVKSYGGYLHKDNISVDSLSH